MPQSITSVRPNRKSRPTRYLPNSAPTPKPKPKSKAFGVPAFTGILVIFEIFSPSTFAAQTKAQIRTHLTDDVYAFSHRKTACRHDRNLQVGRFELFGLSATVIKFGSVTHNHQRRLDRPHIGKSIFHAHTQLIAHFHVGPLTTGQFTHINTCFRIPRDLRKGYSRHHCNQNQYK